MPPVHKLYGDLKDKGFKVRLITFRESPDTLRRVVRERDYTIPALIDVTGDVAGRLYGVVGRPLLSLLTAAATSSGVRWTLRTGTAPRHAPSCRRS